MARGQHIVVLPGGRPLGGGAKRAVLGVVVLEGDAVEYADTRKDIVQRVHGAAGGPIRAAGRGNNRFFDLLYGATHAETNSQKFRFAKWAAAPHDVLRVAFRAERKRQRREER